MGAKHQQLFALPLPALPPYPQEKPTHCGSGGKSQTCPLLAPMAAKGQGSHGQTNADTTQVVSVTQEQTDTKRSGMFVSPWSSDRTAMAGIQTVLW